MRGERSRRQSPERGLEGRGRTHRSSRRGPSPACPSGPRLTQDDELCVGLVVPLEVLGRDHGAVVHAAVPPGCLVEGQVSICSRGHTGEGHVWEGRLGGKGAGDSIPHPEGLTPLRLCSKLSHGELQPVRWDCYLSCLGEKSSLLKLLMSYRAVAKTGVVGRDGLTPLSYGLHTPPSPSLPLPIPPLRTKVTPLTRPDVEPRTDPG